MKKLFNHVAIAGLGLIGGSLARDIRQKKLADTITGYGRSPERMRKAKRLGLIDDFHIGFEKGLDTVDLVIVGTPVRTIIRTLRDMMPYLRPGTIVSDVGSVKASLVAEIEPKMREDIFFIGGHPIAGTENSGFESSLTGLFEGRICVLTPTAGTNRTALAKLEKFWQKVGSQVIRMDAGMHDMVFAGISHLPHMVAFSLVNAIVEMKGFKKKMLTYSAGGFKDFTRIAASDPVMWRDIALMNKDNIINAIEVFEHTLGTLKEAVIKGDGKKIEKFLKKSSDTRREI